MFVKKRNESMEEVQFDKITQRIEKLINNNEKKFINPTIVAQKVVASIYNGITTEELDLESAKISINLCTTHHLYSLLAGKILVSNLHKKTLNTFVEKQELIQQELGILDDKWLSWIKNNREEINKIINYENDYIYDYFGFKTLERSYLIKINNDIIERPQDMILRVALFINQDNLEMAKKTYELLSKGLYTHASPTLFNSGNKRSQLSSCFLLGTDDSLDGITKTWSDVSKISKWGGGIAVHIHNVRAEKSLIKGTNGPSSGIVPMLKVYNEIARYVNQCFVGTTKIYTKKGLINIENLRPHDKVFTLDGTLQNIKRVYCDFYKGKILNLSIYNDYEVIKVTPEHPFYVITNHKKLGFDVIINKLKSKSIAPEWVDANKINNNDLIGFPIPNYINDNLDLDEADCYMYGLVVENGTISNNKLFLLFEHKKDNVDEFLDNYLKQHSIEYSQVTSEKFYKITCTLTNKFKFVKSQFYNNNEKYFNSMILNLPENKVKYVIKAIIDANGSINNTNGSINNEIILKVKNQFISDGLKYILLKMGILGSVCKNIDLPQLWILKIPIVEKIAKLFEININNYEPLSYFEYDNILFRGVKNISEYYIETTVYDLEIDNNHNYLTQNGLVHNGGKRKGSIAIYLEPHHADIMAFLELKKNFGAETERTRDLFTALWISDLFMNQVDIDGDWYLMCPNSCPGLSNVYGEEYEKLYWSYVEQNKYNKKIKAREVMKAILESQLETGTPYIGFKDNINSKSNQKNIGVIKSSNLCVHQDTVILTEQGYKKIKLLKDKKINIWNGYEWSNVVVKQTGINKDLIRINFSNGVSLDCTPEHIFYIQNDNKIIQVPANRLEINNKLIKFNLPKVIEFSNPIKIKYPYTLGVFCNKIFSFNPQVRDTNYTNILKNFDPLNILGVLISPSTPLAPLESYLCDNKKDLLKYIDYDSISFNSNTNKYDIILPQDFYKTGFIETVTEIEVNCFIPMNSSVSDRLRWFEGYCDMNADICYKENKNILRIYNKDKDFLLNIRLMLHTLGIESTIKSCDQGNKLLIAFNELNNLYNIGFSPKILKYIIYNDNNETVYDNDETVHDNDETVHDNDETVYDNDETVHDNDETVYDNDETVHDNDETVHDNDETVHDNDETVHDNDNDEIEYIKIISIEESFKNVDTYCFTEPLKHMGIFNGIISGQCMEIVEYSDEKEYAVCNLASIALNKFVDNFIFNENDEWVIYTKDNCKYCTWAKTFLSNKEVKYIEIKNQLLNSLNTYPQIYHNNKHIGGFDDLYDYTKGIFNYEKLYDVAYVATINLNNIIDINYYPVIESKISNLKHRPIGLGIQGLADALVLLKIPFDSEESLDFNAKFMETIYLAAITASNDISKERYNYLIDIINIIDINSLPEHYDPEYNINKSININNIYHKLKLNRFELENIFNTTSGSYSTFKGSPISEGKFQFDLWNLDHSKLKYRDKWIILKNEVIKYGVRNSLVTALMPTASTSQILGNNECFEFFTNNIYSRRTLAGDFPLVNKYLIDDLHNVGLWSNEIKQLILANNGSINIFNNIPEKIKKLYKNIWEIKQIWVLKNAIARGPFNDQTQSMNIFMQVPDYQKLYSSHFYAWKNGLKTGIYYLRTKPAQEATQVTIDPSIHKKLEEYSSNEYNVCESCSA